MPAVGGAEISVDAVEAAIVEEVGPSEGPLVEAAPGQQQEAAVTTAPTTEADLDVSRGMLVWAPPLLFRKLRQLKLLQ